MRKITKIIVHCSATPEGKQFTAQDIDRWHRQRGFKQIGYHYVIYLDGTIVKGRDEAQIGAHCTGHNVNSIGICYIGGVSADGKWAKDTRTAEQRIALRKLISELELRYPLATLHGHCEFALKDCPCFNVQTDL